MKRADRHRRQTADKCAHLLSEAESALNARDVEQARRLLEQILRVRPNHEIANEYLADLHFKAQHFELGLVHYDRLSRIPDWPPLIYNATSLQRTPDPSIRQARHQALRWPTFWRTVHHH